MLLLSRYGDGDGYRYGISTCYFINELFGGECNKFVFSSISIDV